MKDYTIFGSVDIHAKDANLSIIALLPDNVKSKDFQYYYIENTTVSVSRKCFVVFLKDGNTSPSSSIKPFFENIVLAQIPSSNIYPYGTNISIKMDDKIRIFFFHNDVFPTDFKSKIFDCLRSTPAQSNKKLKDCLGQTIRPQKSGESILVA
jgi:hypothetical protein